MKNVAVTVEDDMLVIKVDLTQDHGPSNSGKTNIIATTNGGKDLIYRDRTVTVSLNVYAIRLVPGKGEASDEAR